MPFEFFDRKEEFVVRHGTLPHWYQPGVTYFVTYRTEDSVPQSLQKSWYARRDNWLRTHGIDPNCENWKVNLREHPELEAEFNAQFTKEFMEYLDHGYGACVFRSAALARIIGDNLRHFDGHRYQLGDFVVMPNHVHLLVCLLGNTEIQAQCKSWKRYTAGEINQSLGRRGRFWQEESFDHLVRSPDQFAYFQNYIADNPQKARLKPGEYLHYKLA